MATSWITSRDATDSVGCNARRRSEYFAVLPSVFGHRLSSQQQPLWRASSRVPLH